MKITPLSGIKWTLGILPQVTGISVRLRLVTEQLYTCAIYGGIYTLFIQYMDLNYQ
jgi:hypothetical protein